MCGYSMCVMCIYTIIIYMERFFACNNSRSIASLSSLISFISSLILLFANLSISIAILSE